MHVRELWLSEQAKCSDSGVEPFVSDSVCRGFEKLLRLEEADKHDERRKVRL